MNIFVSHTVYPLMQEGEIASVSADGYYIELTTPLSYTHHGITEVYEDGQFIEIR